MARQVHLRGIVTVVFSVALVAAGWGLAQQAARPGTVGPSAPVAARVVLRDAAARDQDDMCVWVHPTDPAQSTVIASDKAAGKLFVYDLAGKTIQSLAAGSPGNIDVRYGFALGGKAVDVVAFNQRRGSQVWVYAVDPATRTLRRVDDGHIDTEDNYGGTLYQSRKTGKLYFFSTCRLAEQVELADNGKGQVAGKLVRSWRIGYTEAAVADDEHGKVYYGEEARGVWEVGAEPGDPAPGKLVAPVGEHGLRADVEGLAIYHLPGGEGYLLVSNQSRDCFHVYERTGGHRFLGAFTVQGARDTDGIDVANVALGAAFGKGLFACHSGTSGACPVLLARWDDIAGRLNPPLKIDTSWGPRKAE